MKKLSIVLPIYNVEPYIERCLESLEDQDINMTDYEIICVNDGSPDKSREIVLQLMKEFNNIILIDQENQGVSMARNKGLEHANGKYILFADPDDYIQKNTLGALIGLAELNYADMLIPGYSFVDLDGNARNIRTYEVLEENVYTGTEAYYIKHKSGKEMPDLAVGIIFNTEFLKNNQLEYFPNVVLNQDVELMVRIHCLAKSCIITNKTLYISAARKGSATRSNQFNTERVRTGFILAANNLKKFQKLKKLTQKQKVFLNGPITKFVLLSIYSAFGTRTPGIIIKTISKLKSLDLKRLNLEKTSKYNRICGGFYNISPFLGIGSIFLYQKINKWFPKNLK